MQLSISGQNIDITQSLKQHIEEKLAKISRHFENIMTIHVMLKVEKQQQIAEATIHVAGNDLFAQATNSDMYSSIDKLIDKLDSQVLKHKQKKNDHRATKNGT